MKIFYVWLLAAIGLLLSAPLSCAAQSVPYGYSQVSSSITMDGGVVVANSTIYFAPVSNSGAPISFRATGAYADGQQGPGAFTAQVLAGAFSILLPDPALTSPSNICYSVTIIDNVTGNSHLGPGYTCVQPVGTGGGPGAGWCSGATSSQGGTCNFDLYTPNLAPLVAVQTGPTGSAGATGATGATGAKGDPGTVTAIGVNGDFDVPGTLTAGTIGALVQASQSPGSAWGEKILNCLAAAKAASTNICDARGLEHFSNRCTL